MPDALAPVGRHRWLIQIGSRRRPGARVTDVSWRRNEDGIESVLRDLADRAPKAGDALAGDVIPIQPSMRQTFDQRAT